MTYWNIFLTHSRKQALTFNTKCFMFQSKTFGRNYLHVCSKRSILFVSFKKLNICTFPVVKMATKWLQWLYKIHQCIAALSVHCAPHRYQILVSTDGLRHYSKLNTSKLSLPYKYQWNGYLGTQVSVTANMSLGHWSGSTLIRVYTVCIKCPIFYREHGNNKLLQSTFTSLLRSLKAEL